MSRGGLAAVVVMTAIALGGCSYLSGELDSTAPARGSLPDGPERGKELYQRDCAWCHAATGEGTAKGPDLNGPLDGGAYTDFMLSTGRMPIDEPDERALRRPPRYTDDATADIVAYVESLGGDGPTVPRPVVEAGDLAEGGSLYATNCAACHGATGQGGALSHGRYAPDLSPSTPTQVAEAMLVGPGCPNDSADCDRGDGAMPSFDFDQTQVNSIVAYVDYLRDPDDHGGIGLGRVGPVIEGAVGWIVALGACLIVIRFIGTRADDT